MEEMETTGVNRARPCRSWKRPEERRQRRYLPQAKRVAERKQCFLRFLVRGIRLKQANTIFSTSLMRINYETDGASAVSLSLSNKRFKVCRPSSVVRSGLSLLSSRVCGLV